MGISEQKRRALTDAARPIGDLLIDGVLLTEPKIRGILVAEEMTRMGKVVGLRVVVATPLGTPVAKIEAKEMEITVVDAIDPKTDKPRAYPYAFWFYGFPVEEGKEREELGFLPDMNGGALTLPMSVERARKGPDK